jgi:hypothetical protein
MKQNSPEALAKAFVRVIRRHNAALLPVRFRREKTTPPLSEKTPKTNQRWRFPGIHTFADRLGIDRSHVYRVLTGERRSPRVEAEWPKFQQQAAQQVAPSREHQSPQNPLS